LGALSNIDASITTRSLTVTTTPSPDDERLKSQVSKELEEAKGLAKSLDFEKIKTGEWFKQMFEAGLITQGEFDAKKAEILTNI